MAENRAENKTSGKISQPACYDDDSNLKAGPGNKQAPSRSSCSLLTVVMLELKTPSNACFNEPTFIWTKEAALRGSRSLTSPVHLA